MKDLRKLKRSISVAIVLAASSVHAADPPAALPTANAAQPPSAPPAGAPPPPPAPPPAPQSQPIEPLRPPSQAPTPSFTPPNGQWVYTNQYGWLWLPHDQSYTHVDEDANLAYAFVYYPAFGWRWVVAPWVLGLGPVPYWGTLGPRPFVWYHRPWFRFGGPYRGWRPLPLGPHGPVGPHGPPGGRPGPRPGPPPRR